jgi:hypothetical protein
LLAGSDHLSGLNEYLLNAITDDASDVDHSVAWLDAAQSGDGIAMGRMGRLARDFGSRFFVTARHGERQNACPASSEPSAGRSRAIDRNQRLGAGRLGSGRDHRASFLSSIEGVITIGGLQNGPVPDDASD